ncbi:DUF2721 domain-containing protein [Mesosutterella sp. AGMB02718]|uniref:DUF2721 domain-containing protein n=1 Tax=Mesosutterella faecium TaxID=2925194 RepID=A0ABT7IQR4_9BURK|nr:DUF2721 domain-containing protein [Mesosutterella sp. AGMB02718]MDL2060241.1 DUF2721 domain-containing protein [Mesosutterella sp. AGMB02718]
MAVQFSSVLLSALTPVTLISGVGLLLLSMTNRYSHATNRIRELLREKASQSDKLIDPELDASIELIYKRAWYLRRAMLCMAVSVTFSACIVLCNVLDALFGIRLDVPESVLLLCGMALTVVSMIYFVLEISTSLHALGLTVHPRVHKEN